MSITLIILQPVAVGAWCTMSLISAAAMLVMIPLTIDEVVAMIQFLRSSKRDGTSYWHAFWFGGTPAGTHDAPPPDRQPSWSPGAMLWGFTPTGGLLVASGLGAWMMFAPAVFGSSGVMRDSSFVVGALVIVVSVIAMADLARVARYFNLALGAWLVVAPWVLSDVEAGARWNAVLVGLLVSVASLPLGAGATGTGARRGRRSGSRATRRGSVAGDLLSPVTRPLTEAGRWRGTVAGREGSWTVYAAPGDLPLRDYALIGDGSTAALSRATARSIGSARGASTRRRCSVGCSTRAGVGTSALGRTDRRRSPGVTRGTRTSSRRSGKRYPDGYG